MNNDTNKCQGANKKLSVMKVEQNISMSYASKNQGIVFIFNDAMRKNKESAIFYESLPDGRELLAEVCINTRGKYQAHIILGVDTGKPLMKMIVKRSTFSEFFDWMCGAIMLVRREPDNYFRA